MKTLGEVLAEARKRRGLILKAVAARVLNDDGKPMSQPYLNDIELGHKAFGWHDPAVGKSSGGRI
jgi:cytoskeletal protein RodZ